MQHLYTLDFSGFDKIKSFERFTISLILRDQRCGKHRHSFFEMEHVADVHAFTWRTSPIGTHDTPIDIIVHTPRFTKQDD